MASDVEVMEAEPFDARPLANVLWLVDPPAWQDALTVGGGRAPLAQVLSVRFENVAATGWPDPDNPRLAFPSQRFDLVAIDACDADRARTLLRQGGTYAWRDLLTEARRVLRAGGVLVISGYNPRWFRTFFRTGTAGRKTGGSAGEDLGAMPRAQVLALLADSGWSHPIALSSEPAGYAPRYLFPASRLAARTQERMSRRRSLATALRRLAAAMGLHEWLYPGRIFIAAR